MRHIKVFKIDFSFGMHTYECISPYCSGIYLAVSDRIDDSVLCADKLKLFEIPIRINPHFFQFPPYHPPAPQRAFGCGYESFAFEIIDLSHVTTIRPPENHPPIFGIKAIETQIFQCSDTVCSIPVFQFHIKGWVSQNKIDFSPFNRRVNLFMIQWYNHKSPVRNPG